MIFNDVTHELKRSLSDVVDIYLVRRHLPSEAEERNGYDNSRQWASIYGKVGNLASDITYQVSSILGIEYDVCYRVADVAKYENPKELADDLKRKVEEE